MKTHIIASKLFAFSLVVGAMQSVHVSSADAQSGVWVCRDNRTGARHTRSQTPCPPGYTTISSPGGGGGGGSVGATGPTGPTGLMGPAGPAGAPGPAGLAGLPGATGATGATGLNGATGATGATGPAAASVPRFYFSGSNSSTPLSPSAPGSFGYAINAPQNFGSQIAASNVAVVAGSSCSRIGYQMNLSVEPGPSNLWAFYLGVLSADTYGVGPASLTTLCSINGDNPGLKTCSGERDHSIDADDMLFMHIESGGSPASTLGSWSVFCLEAD